MAPRASPFSFTEEFVTDWRFAQKDPTEQLAQLHFFSVMKPQKGGDVSFQVTVKEYVAPPPGQFVLFFAQADKYVNQKTAPILPSGWGKSLLEALSDCVRIIRQFPYEVEDPGAST
jgi:hypothetical protein